MQIVTWNNLCHVNRKSLLRWNKSGTHKIFELAKSKTISGTYNMTQWIFLNNNGWSRNMLRDVAGVAPALRHGIAPRDGIARRSATVCCLVAVDNSQVITLFGRRKNHAAIFSKGAVSPMQLLEVNIKWCCQGTWRSRNNGQRAQSKGVGIRGRRAQSIDDGR